MVHIAGDDAKAVNPINPVDDKSVKQKQEEKALWEQALAAQAKAQGQQGVQPPTLQQTQQGINRIAALNTAGGGQPATDGVRALTPQELQSVDIAARGWNPNDPGIGAVGGQPTTQAQQPAQQQKDEPFFKIDKGKLVIGGVTPGVGVDRTFELKEGKLTPKDVPFLSLKANAGPGDVGLKLKFDPKALGVEISAETKMGKFVPKLGVAAKIEKTVQKTLESVEAYVNGAVGNASGKVVRTVNGINLETQIANAGGNVAGTSKAKSTLQNIPKTLQEIFSPTKVTTAASDLAKATIATSDAAKATTVASDLAKATTVATDAAKGASWLSKVGGPILKVAGPILKVAGEVAGPVGFVLPFLPDLTAMNVNQGQAAFNYGKGAVQWVTGDQQGAAQSFGTANALNDQNSAHANAIVGRAVSPLVAAGNEVVNQYNVGLKEGNQINPVLGVVDGIVRAALSGPTTAMSAGATQLLIGGDGAANAASKAAASHDIGKTATAIVQGTQKDQKEIQDIVPNVVNWVGGTAAPNVANWIGSAVNAATHPQVGINAST